MKRPWRSSPGPLVPTRTPTVSPRPADPRSPLAVIRPARLTVAVTPLVHLELHGASRLPIAPVAVQNVLVLGARHGLVDGRVCRLLPRGWPVLLGRGWHLASGLGLGGLARSGPVTLASIEWLLAHQIASRQPRGMRPRMTAVDQSAMHVPHVPSPSSSCRRGIRSRTGWSTSP